MNDGVVVQLLGKVSAEFINVSISNSAVRADNDLLEWFFFSRKGSRLFLSELLGKAVVERIAGHNSDFLVKELKPRHNDTTATQRFASIRACNPSCYWLIYQPLI